MSMAKLGVHLKFKLGTSYLTREFVITRLSGRNKMILGYTFLKEVNPEVDWTTGTVRLRNTGE